MRPAAFLLVLLLLLAATRPAPAIEPGEALADPAEEARARAISREIRCLVCQNENIDESGADLARDLRRIVRERLAAGDSDQAVRDYLVARYGDFVLLRPPLKPKTYLLWFAPPAILLLAGLGLFIHYRRQRTAEGPPPLDEAERQVLARLLAAPPDGEAR
jgi:cytochrome c-type biogenesis protein CcmH